MEDRKHTAAQLERNRTEPFAGNFMQLTTNDPYSNLIRNYDFVVLNSYNLFSLRKESRSERRRLRPVGAWGTNV